MNLDDYIKNLAPELQEKARACSSTAELLALAKEAKIPVPDEVLAAIAGGEDPDAGYCVKPKCPRCGSKNTEPCDRGSVGILVDDEVYRCKDCGYKWHTLM